MASIARAVDIKAKILILDEPTSSLDEHEVGSCSGRGDLKSEGLGIIFITTSWTRCFRFPTDHGAQERKARRQLRRRPDHQARPGHLHDRQGHEPDLNQARGQKPGAETMLEAEHIGIPARWRTSRSPSRRRAARVCGAPWLRAHRDGGDAVRRHAPAARRTEAARQNDGAQSSFGRHQPEDGVLPEDRKRDGIIGGPLGAREHLPCGAGQARVFEAHAPAGQQEMAEKYIKLLSIATPDAEKKVGELSAATSRRSSWRAGWRPSRTC